MTEPEIVAPTHDDIVELVRTMRQADIDEIWAASMTSPYDALVRSVKVSRDTYAGKMDDEVVCIFGVAPVTVLGTIGIPWMLASDLLPQHSRAFLRANRPYIHEMRNKYSLLINFVDARNTDSVRWLRWLGFDVARFPTTYGPYGLPFFRFEMKRTDYV
jgi:hypothetical protein